MDKPKNLNEYYALFLDQRAMVEGIINTNKRMNEIEAALSQVPQSELEAWGLKPDAAKKLIDITGNRKVAWKSIKEHEIIKEGIPKVL